MSFETPRQPAAGSFDGQTQPPRNTGAHEHLQRDSQPADSKHWHPGHNKEWTQAMQATLHKDLKVNSDGTYTVQHPDCLSSIAARELHMMGKQATKKAIDKETEHLIELNKDRYPGLANNRDLIIGGSQKDGKAVEGWHLRLSLGEHPDTKPPRPKQAARAHDPGSAQDSGLAPPPAAPYRGRQMPPEAMPYRQPPQEFAGQQNFDPRYERRSLPPQQPQGQDIGRGLAAIFGGLAGGMLSNGMFGQRHGWNGGWGRPRDYDGYDRDYDRRFDRGYDNDNYYRTYGSNNFIPQPQQAWNGYSGVPSYDGSYNYDRSYGAPYRHGWRQPYRQNPNRGGIANVLGILSGIV